jgi:RHS repeat-associated protein
VSPGYDISIVDAATGQFVFHTNAGKTMSTTVSQPTGVTKRYVAQVDSGGGPPVQAVSSPQVVTWSTPVTNGPVVSSLSPISGVSTGGTSVTITGANFTGATAVKFGSTAATSFTVNSSTTITATAPAGPGGVGGTVDIAVTTPTGTATSQASDEYTYTSAISGWGVTVSASPTAPTLGGVSTVTATANQDVGPTAFGLSVVDVTAGVVVAHVGSGTTATALVTQASASTHRFVGEVDVHGEPDIAAVSTPVQVTWSSSVSNPFGYAGEYTDTESGLVYLRARYYDPATGQFLTRDPLASASGSPYGYADGDPLNGADPSGLNKCEIGANPLRWAGNAVDCASKARVPDYVTVDLSGGDIIPGPIPLPLVGGGNVTLTRTGHIYYGPEGGVGVPGFSGAIRAGWINQTKAPTCQQLDSYVHGWGATGSAYVPFVAGIAGLSIAETWGNQSHPGNLHPNDFSTEVGVGVGAGKNVSVTETYDFRAPFNLPGW